MSLKHQMARKEIISTGQMILDAAMVIGTWGNISVRIAEDDLIAITPSGVDYKTLIPENIPILDMEGNRIDGNLKPSVELPMHLAIYKSRPDVFAIVHTHSVFCTAMAIARQPIPAACEDLIQSVGGGVRVAAYKPPGSMALGEAVVDAIKNRKAVIMANHGLLTVGKNLKEAIKVAQICEKTAQATLLAANLGGAIALSDKECEEMLSFYTDSYGQVQNITNR